MKDKRRCLFCPNPANSKEHIIALRLLSRMQREAHKFRIAQFSEAKGLSTRRPTIGNSFLTKRVCKQCNNLWMNKMEDWFENRLGFLIEPEWPTWGDTVCYSIREDGLNLLRWLAKTAIMYECAVFPFELPVVAEDVREMVVKNSFTNDFRVYLAAIEESDFDARLVKGLPTWNGGRLHFHQINKKGFCFAVQFNHLAMVLIRCPEAEVQIKSKLVTLDRRHVVPFPVYPGWKFLPRAAHRFPTFDSFFETFEINADAYHFNASGPIASNPAAH